MSQLKTFMYSSGIMSLKPAYQIEFPTVLEYLATHTTGQSSKVVNNGELRVVSERVLCILAQARTADLRMRPAGIGV